MSSASTQRYAEGTILSTELHPMVAQADSEMRLLLGAGLVAASLLIVTWRRGRRTHR